MPIQSENHINQNESDYLPVYVLNAFIYCSRLFWYEYVEGLEIVNDQVAEGRVKHKRVDEQPAKTTAVDKETLQTRSVHLSSDKYHITGKIDVLEEKAGETYPVEYKKHATSKNHDNEPLVWDNEKIQLCAQALLLEDNNFGVINKGYLYYIASKTRVEVVFDEALRQKSIEAIHSALTLAERKIPEPLKDDNRCIHCSLLPICIPEETNRINELSASSQTSDVTPLRRIIPEKQEGYVAYINQQGARVGKKGDNLIVTTSKGEPLQEIHLYHLEQLVIFGNVGISTQALTVLLEANIPIVYLSIYGKFKGTTCGIPSKNIHLRLAQYQSSNNQTLALSIARAITAAKINNQRVMLMRNLPDNGEQVRLQLQQLINSATDATDLASLLGFEGSAARYYFGLFTNMLKVEGDFFACSFEGRNRRPPSDPVNALLSFAYTLLVKDCFSACLTVGLDPYLGFYHQAKYGRPALALDLMEEFRPVIADSVVLTLINNKMVAEKDFLINKGACYLTESGRRTFFQAYEQRRNDMVTHPVFGYEMSYSRVLETQARLLARVITGEIPEYIGFKVR